jgi:hypothetical protein
MRKQTALYVLVFAVGILFSGDCACRKVEREPEYPRVALSHARCYNLPDSVLWAYDEIHTQAQVHHILAIKQRAEEAGQTEWLDHVRIYQVACLMTCPIELETELPSWTLEGSAHNPRDAIQRAVYENAQLGVSWFLHDDTGQPLHMWGGGSYHMLDMSDACPKGVWGPTAGLTLAQYMASEHFRDIFLRSPWRKAFDGIQFEDGPPKYGVPCYTWGYDREIVVADSSMPCREFMQFAKISFDRWLRECPGYLTRYRVLTRSNGAFTSLHQRRDYPPAAGQFNGCKLEHFGNWSDWPEDDLLAWTDVYLELEDTYKPFGDAHPALDLVQGWDVSTCQITVSIGWSFQRQMEWQETMIALTLMGDASVSLSWLEDAEQYSIGTPPVEHPVLRHNLGKPLGDYQEATDGEGRTVYWRYFKHKGKVQTVGFNPNGERVLGLKDGGTWFAGKWQPDA